MRKVLVLLLVVGFLIGTFAAVAEVHEEVFFHGIDFSEVDFGDSGSNPAPCGGGNGSGGGAPG